MGLSGVPHRKTSETHAGRKLVPHLQIGRSQSNPKFVTDQDMSSMRNGTPLHHWDIQTVARV